MTIQEIKQRFFSFRNGIVAKTFYDAGSGYKTVFGLQLPQLATIARECGYDAELAELLWADGGCRESRLLACYLFDPATLPQERALELAAEVNTREEADILAWRLLSKTPDPAALLPHLSGYIREALSRNL